MLEVKHFVGGTTRSGLRFVEDEMNSWIKEQNITEIKFVNETFGQAPTGMSGSPENVIFISVWYEKTG